MTITRELFIITAKKGDATFVCAEDSLARITRALAHHGLRDPNIDHWQLHTEFTHAKWHHKARFAWR